MYETNIIRGELVVQKRRIHNGAYNVLVIPGNAPSEWFFKQFPTEELITEFALEHCFSIRKEGVVDES